MQTTEQFKQECVDRFNGQEHFAYFGDLESPPWGLLGFVGQHRDSDPLDRSNFEVITNDLLEKHPDSFRIERSSNWLVGWSEGVRIDTSDDRAVDLAQDWQLKLDDYPVADDEHYSNLEREDDQSYYECGGREDLISKLEEYEELEYIFDSEGEFLPEYEDALNDLFHRAMAYGDHTAIPNMGVDEELWIFDERRVELILQARDEYEKYQPPIENLEV